MKAKTLKQTRRKKYCDTRGQFKPGNPGRPKGTLNRASIPFVSVKHSILEAFNDPRIGGTEGLIQWVCERRGRKKIFYNWIMRLLPKTVDIEPASPLDDLLNKWKEVSNEDLAAKAEALAQEIINKKAKLGTK